MYFVKAMIRCRCGEQMSWCVRIARAVPTPLRCVPSTAGGSGGLRAIFCPHGHRCMDGPEELERAVEVLTSGGWGRWLRAGAVIVEC
jgi:hypothetical protein